MHDYYVKKAYYFRHDPGQTTGGHMFQCVQAILNETQLQHSWENQTMDNRQLFLFIFTFFEHLYSHILFYNKVVIFFF